MRLSPAEVDAVQGEGLLPATQHEPKDRRPGVPDIVLAQVHLCTFVMNLLYGSIYLSIYPSIHPSIYLSMVG